MSAVAAGETLVGRQRELADVSIAVQTALSGDGCLVLVRGEAGIGKTRLLESVVADLADRAAAVWGACWQGTGVPPFWPWVQILRECARMFELEDATGGDDMSDLALFLPNHDGDPGAGVTGDDMSEHRRLRLFDGVATFLEQAAQQRPLVLVLDDLQWADMSSLHLLRFLGLQLRHHPIAVVGSHRYPDVAADSPFAAEFGDLVRSARTLMLTGLNHDAARELIRQTAGVDPADHLVESVHKRTAGNPLFVTEIIRLLDAQGRLGVAAGRDDAAFPIPLSVRHVIAQRLRHVGASCRALLSRACVLGEEFQVEPLQAMADDPPEHVAVLLDEGINAGLLVMLSSNRCRFSHGLVREALYADLPPPVRSQLHHRAGEAIEHCFRSDLVPRLGELARHFRLAGGADKAKALDYARRAAEQALAMLAYEVAAAYFASAVDLVPGDEPTRMELQLRLGDALIRAGDRDAAVTTFDEAARSARRRGDADRLARAALGLGAGLSGFEVPLFDQAQVDLLQESLDALGDEDSALRALVLARLSVATSFVWPPEQRAALSREAISVARRVGDKAALAYALSSYCDATSGPAHTEERVAVATEMVTLGQQTGNREMELLGRRFAVVAHLELGHVAAVDADIEAFARVADALRVPLYRWYVPLWRGMRALMEGRLADCDRLLAQAREIGEQAHSRNATVLTDAQRNVWLIESGQAAEACRRMEGYLTDPERGPNVAGVLAALLAQTGQQARARALLTRLAADDFETVVLEDTFALATLCFAADGAADLRARDAAARLYRVLAPYARRFGISGIANSCIGSVSRFLGRLASVLQQWEQADSHFRDALDDHRRAGATLLVAHTLRDRAAMLFDRDATADDREAAAGDLDEAIAIYTELDLRWWIDQAEKVRPKATAAARSVPGVNIFQRDGSVWKLVYAGAEARVKDAKGLHVIAQLLAHRGKEFHVLDLLTPAGTGDVRLRDRDEPVTAPGDAGEVLDARARREYKGRLTALEQELEEAEAHADVARAAKVRVERDLLVAELSAAYGLTGRARRAHDPAERARWTVTKRIHTTLGNLEELHSPLAQHLKNSLRTGVYCGYFPEEDTPWAL